MLSAIGWWLSQIIPADGRVIELGGGSGALAEAVLTKMPGIALSFGTMTPGCPQWQRGQTLTTLGPRHIEREVIHG